MCAKFKSVISGVWHRKHENKMQKITNFFAFRVGLRLPSEPLSNTHMRAPP